tara:strand:+ start:173 stop:3367 length:3195 start_codon:yes stop_codon:yes gene_type:complete
MFELHAQLTTKFMDKPIIKRLFENADGKFKKLLVKPLKKGSKKFYVTQLVTPNIMIALYNLSTVDDYFANAKWDKRWIKKLREVIMKSKIPFGVRGKRKKMTDREFFQSFCKHMQSIRKEMEDITAQTQHKTKYGNAEKQIFGNYIPWKYQILNKNKTPFSNYVDISLAYPLRDPTPPNQIGFDNWNPNITEVKKWFKEMYGVTFFPIKLNDEVKSIDQIVAEIEQKNRELYAKSLAVIGEMGQMLPPILLQSSVSDESKEEWLKWCKTEAELEPDKSIIVDNYHSFISTISPHDVKGVHWQTAMVSWNRKYDEGMKLGDLLFEIVTVISNDVKNGNDEYNKQCQQVFTQLYTFQSIKELEKDVSARKMQIKVLNEPIVLTQDISKSTNGVVKNKVNMQTGLDVLNDKEGREEEEVKEDDAKEDDAKEDDAKDIMEFWVEDTTKELDAAQVKKMISDCFQNEGKIIPNGAKILAIYNKHYRNLSLTLNVILRDKFAANLKQANFVSLNLDIEDPHMVDDISEVGLLWQPQRLKLTRKDFKWTAAVDPVERLRNTLSGIEHITEYIAEKRDEFKFAVGIFGELDRSKLPTQTNLLFTGNSGTGKTTVALEMAQAFFEAGIIPTSNTTVRSASDLEGTHVGEAQEIVQKTMEEAIGGLLLIDEAYELGKSEYGRQAQTKLIAMLSEEKFNNGKVVVILCGYKEDMDKMLAKNQGMASRFGKELNFKDMSPTVALGIIVDLLKKDFINVSNEAKEAMKIFLGTTDYKNGVMFMPGWGNFRDCKVLRNNIKQIMYSNAFKTKSDVLPQLQKKVAKWKEKHKKQPSLEELITSKFAILNKKYTEIEKEIKDNTVDEQAYMNAVREGDKSKIQILKNRIETRIKEDRTVVKSDLDDAEVATVQVSDVIKGFGDFFLNRIPLPKREKGMKKTEFKHGIMKDFLEKKQQCSEDLKQLQKTTKLVDLKPLIHMWFERERLQQVADEASWARLRRQPAEKLRKEEAEIARKNKSGKASGKVLPGVQVKKEEAEIARKNKSVNAEVYGEVLPGMQVKKESKKQRMRVTYTSTLKF